MNKILFLIVFLLSNINLFAQDWAQQGAVFFKQNDNIVYLVDSTMNANIRNDIVAKTKEYIAHDLDILQESEFNESLLIMLLHSRNEIHKHFGKRNTSFIVEKGQNDPENSIVCVYDPKHCTLNRELMTLILIEKWGAQNDNQLTWLKEGLATYVTPEADSCDGHSIEERYIYFGIGV